MGKLLNGDAALGYLWVSVRARIAKARSGELERGASAVEWVVISMIVVTIVAVVGYAISTALKDRAANVSTCIGNTNGTGNSAGC